MKETLAFFGGFALVLGLAGATLSYAAATSQPAAACEQHTS